MKFIAVILTMGLFVVILIDPAPVIYADIERCSHMVPSPSPVGGGMI